MYRHSFRWPHSQIWLGLQLRVRDWTINNFAPFVLYTINNKVYTSTSKYALVVETRI